MKTSTKILLSVGGVFALLVLIVAAFVIYVYLGASDEYKKKFAAAQAKGREFGAKADGDGCVKEGLSRAKTTPMYTIDEGAVNRAFVEECLKTSRPVGDFCQGVPSVLDINEMDWRKEQCRKVGMDEVESGCLSVFDKKREYCIFDKK